MKSNLAISLEKAFELCKTHRERNGIRLFSQCWGCVKYSNEDPEKMCFYKPPTNDACKFVNRLYESSTQYIKQAESGLS
jgi:hypothetical protein